MKKRPIAFLLFFLSFFLVLSSDAITADDGSEEPHDELILDNREYKQDRKGPVLFTHLNHAEDYEVSCEECHHDYYDGENAWKEGDPVVKCTECHDPIENDGEVKKLKVAYHRNCIGCHKGLAEDGISEDAPRNKCYECHDKK